MKSLQKIGIGIVLASFGILLYSVFVSGLRYQYDADELGQSHTTYLIAHGIQPYLSLWWPYSVLFNYLLLPFFWVFGFSFSTIYILRFVMIGLYIVRLIVSFEVVRTLHSKMAGWIVVALIMLDPFTTFSGMQIRQDNLMMTLFVIGVYAYVRGILSRSKTYLIGSGFILALSVISLIKILPSVCAIGFLLFVWSVMKKRMEMVGMFLVGSSSAVALYCTFFIANGMFVPMIQQTIVDPYTFQGNVMYPTPATFFYKGDNTFIFGVGGKPLTWVFVHILPIMAIIGIIISVVSKQWKQLHTNYLIYVSFGIALMIQAGLLFHIKSAYMQYHLPVQWFFAFFGSIALGTVLKRMIFYPVVYNSILVAYILAFGFVASDAIIGNIARSRIDIHWTVDQITETWKKIPEDAYVFPDYLFRKTPYMLTNQDFAGNAYGPTLLARYGPIWKRLESNNVGYLYLSDYTMGFIPEVDRAYIDAHYDRLDKEIYIRKK